MSAHTTCSAPSVGIAERQGGGHIRVFEQQRHEAHGGLMLLAGGSVRGARMVGDFAGLDDSRLDDARGLPVLVDWRSVLAARMDDAFGMNAAALDLILPGRPRQRLEL